MSIVVNRNATPTNFGFQYQINVAIYFLFHYLKDIKNIRVEGEKQDVEILMNNNKKYMIQAKSKVNDIYDGRDNPKKLRESLTSLSSADSNEVEKLIYASNMFNPLNTSTNEFFDYDITTWKYCELTDESKMKINHQIEELQKKQAGFSIDKNKLTIIKIPFYGDEDSEKYKYIYREVGDMLSNISDNLYSKRREIVSYYESKFLNNSASNPKIKITKKEICNLLILKEIDSMDLSRDSEYIGIDDIEYYDAYNKYKEHIDKKINNYECISKVYAIYIRARKKKSIRLSDFVQENNVKLYNYFFNKNYRVIDEIPQENRIDLSVSQILGYAILMKKNIIDKIMEVSGDEN